MLTSEKSAPNQTTSPCSPEIRASSAPGTSRVEERGSMGRSPVGYKGRSKESKVDADLPERLESHKRIDEGFGHRP